MGCFVGFAKALPRVPVASGYAGGGYPDRVCCAGRPLGWDSAGTTCCAWSGPTSIRWRCSASGQGVRTYRGRTRSPAVAAHAHWTASQRFDARVAWRPRSRFRRWLDRLSRLQRGGEALPASRAARPARLVVRLLRPCAAPGPGDGGLAFEAIGRRTGGRHRGRFASYTAGPGRRGATRIPPRRPAASSARSASFPARTGIRTRSAGGRVHPPGRHLPGQHHACGPRPTTRATRSTRSAGRDRT